MRWFFIAVLYCGVAAAGTIDPSTPDSKHLDYGEQFSCVARISCREKSTEKMAHASCVIVGPHHIVTAGHVVSDSDGWIVRSGTSVIPLVDVWVHPQFRTGVHDIAVGRSKEDFGLARYPGLYGDDNERGRVVSICGYGITGTFFTGSVISDGKKRGGSNIVDYIDTKDLIVCSVGSGVATALEFLIAPGDSGGGLFIGDDLAGVNSVVMVSGGRSPNSRWGEESGHTRISTHKEWILERIKE
jgi:hypothetical protein